MLTDNTLPNFGYMLGPNVNVYSHANVQDVAQEVMKADEKKDTWLWAYLFQAFPNWSHGLQGIGDCESWSWAHNADIEMGLNVCLGLEAWEAQAASEVLYGFMRVEFFGRPDYGGDGAYGGAASEAIKKFGSLHRLKYLNDKYDFTQYSGARARKYGSAGVPDELEPEAVKFSAAETVLVKTFEQAGALLQQGYSISCSAGRNPICSRRDADGFGTDRRPAGHAMNYTAVRYGSRPGLWCANTGHGNHVSGPTGVIPPHMEAMPLKYAQCGWWLDAQYVEKVLQENDSFAVAKYSGFKLRKLPDYGNATVLD
jgi:hypothetical protein